MNTEERDKRIDYLVARFKADEVFKQALLSDPAGTLEAEGVEIPADTEIRTLVNANGELLLMARNSRAELSDDDLAKVAGGASLASSSWSVLGGYRLWDANRKEFLYPENWL